MTANLGPYPEYKESGLPWLGKVPTHWDCLPHRAIFNEIKEQGYVNEPLLSVTISKGIIRQADLLANSSKKDSSNLDKSKYKLVETGDIAYNKMRAWQGAIGVSQHRGIVSPAYIVVRPRRADNPDYFHFLFRTPGFAKEAERWSYGITSDMWSLRPEHFKLIYSCIPPRSEQDAIVGFLRGFDAKVRRFIRNRRRLIEVLNEQKQAIVNRSVTLGLDPNVRLKPSGIEWLGEIPKHWQVRRLKMVGRVIMGQSPPSSECNVEGIGLPFLQGSAEFGVDHPSAVQHCLTAPKTAPANAILFSVRAPVGAMNVADQDYVIGRGLCAIVTNRDILDRGFAMHVISACKVQLLMIATGSTYDAVSVGEVGTMLLPLPPRDEQREIAQQISLATANLSKAVEHAQLEIDLIREYRSRIITNVVTGKLDVRHLAQETTQTADIIRFPMEKKKTTRTANVYFKRAVFAAEIVARLHKEPTFGHVKFEKLIFLCEKKCGVDIGSTYYRHAAGPYDNRALRSIDSQMKKQKWYVAQMVEGRYLYVSLAKAGAHKTYFNRYFSDIEKEFSNIIETFRKFDTEQCEIVATLYSAWEDLLTNGREVSYGHIVEQVLHHWHPSKLQIDESRWQRALQWMKQEGLVPNVSGATEAMQTEFLNDDENIGDDTLDEDN